MSFTFNRSVLRGMSIPYHLGITLGYGNGISHDAKFGAEEAIGGSFAVISRGSLLWLPTVASTIRVKAGGNAADTAAGTGAQEITLEGLDANGIEATDTLVTAGASASAVSTKTFLRLNRVYVSDAGSGEVNAADMTLEVGAGGTDVMIITSGGGQSETSHISVPTGKALVISSFSGYVDTAQAATIRLIHRSQGVRRNKQTHFGVEGHLPAVDVPDIGLFSALSSGIQDVWVEAKATAGTADVSTRMPYLFITFD